MRHANATLLEEVDRLYRPTLENLDVPNPRLLILFSGPPSSGKSTIAKALERRFKAVRLENDAVRTILTSLRPDMNIEDKSRIAYQYMLRLCEELLLSSPNGLWIVDSSVDRTYDQKIGFAHENGFDTLLLAMSIPEDVHRQWIIAGGDRPSNSADRDLKTMASFRKQQQDFLRNHTPDIVIEPGYSMEYIHEVVKHRLARQS